MGIHSLSTSASLNFCNLSLNPRNPTLHQFGFLSTAFASPLRTSPSSVYVQRACDISCQRPVGRRVSCSLLKVEEDINDEACELVSGIELSVGEGEDSINAHLFKAVKNNNGTGILLLSDIYGFEDSSTREFAYRVACNGYNVLLPDLFRGDPWTKHKPKILFDEWILKQEPQRVAKDIATSAKWMVDEFLAVGISKKLCLVGFCFGGGKVIDVLARDQGAYFGIGVSFYGTRSDPSVASDVKVPVLFISGDNDPLCPVNVLENIEKSIGRGSRLVTFKGRGHGFAHRPQSAEEDEDAEKAFMIMRNWLNDGLVAPTE
uniref:carboxymethylenebutenolidase homolog isoform X1 n=1 Tax=Fragaria vesca subsp. vesca TaxID=101020 RepID=UPI0005C9C889|nr:PREDICTED: carboxymethylenebutenolidase homolog isoform X1 [Fragaria vesca subsp. vesca]